MISQQDLKKLQDSLEFGIDYMNNSITGSIEDSDTDKLTKIRIQEATSSLVLILKQRILHMERGKIPLP